MSSSTFLRNPATIWYCRTAFGERAGMGSATAQCGSHAPRSHIFEYSDRLSFAIQGRTHGSAMPSSGSPARKACLSTATYRFVTYP